MLKERLSHMYIYRVLGRSEEKYDLIFFSRIFISFPIIIKKIRSKRSTEDISTLVHTQMICIVRNAFLIMSLFENYIYNIYILINSDRSNTTIKLENCAKRKEAWLENKKKKYKTLSRLLVENSIEIKKKIIIIITHWLFSNVKTSWSRPLLNMYQQIVSNEICIVTVNNTYINIYKLWIYE